MRVSNTCVQGRIWFSAQLLSMGSLGDALCCIPLSQLTNQNQRVQLLALQACHSFEAVPDLFGRGQACTCNTKQRSILTSGQLPPQRRPTPAAEPEQNQFPPVSKLRASRQHLKRTGIQHLPICRAVLATIDTLGDFVELASVGQSVEPLGGPEPCR